MKSKKQGFHFFANFRELRKQGFHFFTNFRELRKQEFHFFTNFRELRKQGFHFFTNFRELRNFALLGVGISKTLVLEQRAECSDDWIFNILNIAIYQYYSIQEKMFFEGITTHKGCIKIDLSRREWLSVLLLVIFDDFGMIWIPRDQWLFTFFKYWGCFQQILYISTT